MRDLLTRIAAWVVERPTPVVALAILLSLMGAVGALALEADRNPDSLVDSGSEAYDATEQFYEDFGDEPVRILIEGDLQRLMLSSDLGTILALEGCLAGSDQEGTKGEAFGEGKPSPPACSRLAEERPAEVVFGPATFLNQTAITAEKVLRGQLEGAQKRAAAVAREAANAAKEAGRSVDDQLRDAEAAYQEVISQFQNQLIQAATRYGLTGIPSLSDPTYVQTVVFDPAQPAGTPKARFNFLFPSPDAAMITIRLRPDLTQAERERAIGLFRDVVEDPAFNLRSGDYVVSGVPVIFDGLAQQLSTEIFILLAVALAVMAIVLALVFRPPLRLLPLAIALGAVGVVFGLLAVFGRSLTMASIAVLPVLTGLAVDYAIQFQARFRERLEEGSSPARAAIEAASRGGPVIATALVATAAGFLVLLLSPIPMIRGFGLLLMVGVLVAFALALTAGLAGLSMIRGGGSRSGPSRGANALEAVRARTAPVGERLAGWGSSALAASIRAPGKVLVAGLVLAVAGWIAGTRTELVSDIRQLLPSDLPELQDVDRLEETTGVSGDVYVTVRTDDLTDPQLIGWMASYEDRLLARHGYEPGASSCQDDGVELCPGTTLATLFAGQELPSRNQIRELLDVLPEYFSQAVVKRDVEGDGGTALIGFGIRVMPFDEQKDLIDDIRAQLDPPGSESDPPPGVDVEVVGLPVLAADANASLGSNRYLLTGVGLVVIALVLLAAYRSVSRALVPLIPIALATGWSSLVLEAADVPLNPMSATLGALVVAIATEFSVILAARYHEERDAGSPLGEALRRTYARTGTAVAASGATAIAGFAVLIASDVRMLRDFGLVTVFDLAVALVGVMLVLPAALVWAEGGFEDIRERMRRAPTPEGA
jgi:uncharacterized protein